MIEFLLLTDNGSFSLTAGYVSLGRDRRCTFVLPDSSVLPLHAAIVEHDGRLYLEKHDRKALTFVNRAPIQTRAELYDGDLIDIGPWTLVVRSKQLPRRDEPDRTSLPSRGTPSDRVRIRRYNLSDVSNDDTSSSIIIM